MFRKQRHYSTLDFRSKRDPTLTLIRGTTLCKNRFPIVESSLDSRSEPRINSTRWPYHCAKHKALVLQIWKIQFQYQNQLSNNLKLPVRPKHHIHVDRSRLFVTPGTAISNFLYKCISWEKLFPNKKQASPLFPTTAGTLVTQQCWKQQTRTDLCGPMVSLHPQQEKWGKVRCIWFTKGASWEGGHKNSLTSDITHQSPTGSILTAEVMNSGDSTQELLQHPSRPVSYSACSPLFSHYNVW